MTTGAPLDLEHLRRWIGREERVRDTITPQLVRAFRATMDQEPGSPEAGDAAPNAIQWCLGPATVPMSGLGPDGHPARGGFLPPVPLPRRMWAGGRLDILDRLQVGDEVERVSSISDVTAKEGRSGRLCFVTVDHTYASGRGIAVRERQDIVYRDVTPPGGTGGAKPALAAPRWQRSIEASPVLLFRYSALTFNGHRIHYDRRYCTDEEGYPGLIVHGPLQATLLLEFAASSRDGAVPSSFEFRGVHPLFDGGAFTLNAMEASSGLSLWTADAGGGVCMTAEARW